MKFKLTLFGLAFMLVVSGFVIVLPEDASAADTRTWDGGGADVFAGTHANWVGDVAPIAGDSVVFDAGALPCTWNLSIALDSFSITSGYSGVVSQIVSFSVTSYSQAGGTYTGLYTKNLTDSGAFTKSGGTITSNSLSLVLSGDSTITLSSPIYFASLHINGDTAMSGAGSISVYRAFSVASGKTFTTTSVLNTLNLAPQYANSTMLNAGTIDGDGNFLFSSYAHSYTIVPGTINIPASFAISPGATGSKTFTLGGNAVFGDSFGIYSQHATNTLTFDLSADDYSLSATSITVGARAILNCRGSAITCSGSWDSSLGDILGGTSSVSLSGTGKLLASSTTQSFYDLSVNGRFSLSTDANVLHDLTIGSDSILTTAYGNTLTYDCSGGGSYSNLGTIAGSGTMEYSFDSADMGVTFGTIAVNTLHITATDSSDADRTLTMVGSLSCGNLILNSAHATYLMIFDTTAGDVTIRNTFTNGTRGMVYYGNEWTILNLDQGDSPYNYQISNTDGTYDATNMLTGLVELTGTDFADNATQYAIDNSLANAEVNFANGTFVFRTAHDFYVSGFNTSLFINASSYMTISGSGSSVLEYRDDLFAAYPSGVTIFYIQDTAYNLTIRDLEFACPATVSATYTNAMFLWFPTYARPGFMDLTVEDCTFRNMSYAIWGDGAPFIGSRNRIINNLIITHSSGLALHNGPSGTTFSGNDFQCDKVALFLDTAERVTVTNNIFNRTGTDAEPHYSIYMMDVAKTTTISDNEFYGNGIGSSYGVYIAQVAGKANCENITIRENSFVEYSYPVVAYAADDTVIQDNAFVSSAHYPFLTSAINTKRTIFSGNGNYTFDAGFTGTVTYSSNKLVFSNGMELSLTSDARLINVTVLDSGTTALSWNTTIGSPNVTVTYTVSGLLGDYSYKIFQDETLIGIRDGPSASFSAMGEGEFEIVVWGTKPVSNLILLAVNMVGLGIVVSVIAGFVMPFARDIQARRPIKTERAIRDLIKTVVFIVIGLLMWGLLHQIAIG